jgi:REP element-mobilizing transposase RayT
MPRFRKSSYTGHEHFSGQHRFEHWYRNNTVYFITARCRDRFPAFAAEDAKAIFWDRFRFYTVMFGFVPWVTSLLDNHYHTLGFLRVGENLGPMMQRLHGSVAKLVNDQLPERRTPFFRSADKHDYFDGCLRDVLQARRTYRYVLGQAVRHGIVTDHRLYPHTRIDIEANRAIRRAVELHAFLDDVPYARYQRRQGGFTNPHLGGQER